MDVNPRSRDTSVLPPELAQTNYETQFHGIIIRLDKHMTWQQVLLQRNEHWYQ